VSDEFDVAIVGAGPAGSSAALELASRGRSVVLLEKDVFPRRKVCGEFLSGNGRRRLEGWRLEERARSEGAEVISRGAFSLPGGRSREFALPEPALGLSRAVLDCLLARHAAELGADVRFRHEVVDVHGDLQSGFALSARSPEGGHRFGARVALSAWGRWSPLDLRFGRPFASRRSDRFFGWGAHLMGDSGHLAGRVNLYFFSGGYCGLSRVEHGIVNFAGVVSEKVLRRFGGGWERFTAGLRREHAPLARDLRPLVPDGEILGSQMVLFERHSPVFSGVLALGDSAGVRDPFTGDGQSSAMASGTLAADCVEDFLRGRLSPDGLSERYRAEWTRRLGSPFGWDALFRRLAFSPLMRGMALPFAAPLVSFGFRATRSE
jgi:flavin-dependent dehydrogenase